MILYSFDASAMIYLWDNYPIQNPNFDSMWQWFFGQVAQENFVISDVAIKEVKQKILYSKLEKDIPESAVFIKILNTIIVHKKTPEDLKTVQTIKSTLKIDGEAYGKGVGENDLLLMQKDKALFWLQMKQGRLILVKHNQEIIKFQPFVSWMV